MSIYEHLYSAHYYIGMSIYEHLHSAHYYIDISIYGRLFSAHYYFAMWIWEHLFSIIHWIDIFISKDARFASLIRACAIRVTIGLICVCVFGRVPYSVRLEERKYPIHNDALDIKLW